MTYDHELTLIRQSYPLDEHGNPLTDESGNQVMEEIETVILCGLKSVGRAEFYNAAAGGLKPELVFVVHTCEYNGEKLVEFEEIRYRVIRTYTAGIQKTRYRTTRISETGFEETELVVERVVADG